MNADNVVALSQLRQAIDRAKTAVCSLESRLPPGVSQGECSLLENIYQVIASQLRQQEPQPSVPATERGPSEPKSSGGRRG